MIHPTTLDEYRFYVISDRYGLVAVADSQYEAEDLAVRAAINTARTVYVHDRSTESTRRGDGSP